MNEPIKIDLDAIEAAAKASSAFTEVSSGEAFEVWDVAGSYRAATVEDIAFISAAHPAVVLELVLRLRAAEALSAGRIEQIPTTTEVLVIFTDIMRDLIAEAEEFAKQIRRRCGQQTLVAFFPIEASLESLSEEQMRGAGWVRAVVVEGGAT